MRPMLEGVYFDRWIRSTLKFYFVGVNPELLVVGESVRLSHQTVGPIAPHLGASAQ